MREDYQLSEASRKTYYNHVSEFSEETHKTPQYYYAILAGNEPDVFARFEPLYAAACRLSRNCYWKARLEAIEARHAPFQDAAEPSDCIREKILTHTRILDKYIDSMADGRLDLHEIIELEPLIEPAIRALEHLRESLSFRRGVLEAENEKSRSRNSRRIGSGN